jgi:hypothetical protein
MPKNVTYIYVWDKIKLLKAVADCGNISPIMICTVKPGVNSIDRPDSRKPS